jgi:hypothetical protein
LCNEERGTIEHMWNGCSEMRERERKERGEILNEDGRDERDIQTRDLLQNGIICQQKDHSLVADRWNRRDSRKKRKGWEI